MRCSLIDEEIRNRWWFWRQICFSSATVKFISCNSISLAEESTCEQRAAAWGVTTSPISDPLGSHRGQANLKAGTLVALNHLLLGIVSSLLVMWHLGKQAWGYWVGRKETYNLSIYIFNSINTAWRCSPDWESRAWLHGWVIRWLAAWSHQLSSQRPAIHPGCSVSWTDRRDFV